MKQIFYRAMKRIRQWLNFSKPIWLVSTILVVGGIIFIHSFYHASIDKGGRIRTGEIQEVKEIIRFHVKANSNSPKDQELKNYLAKTVVNLYEPLWGSCSKPEELRSLLLRNRKALEITATEILQKKGCSHDVKVSLEKSIFPARFYEGELYPPGEYEALYMVIGEGNGENWWCVLFPPLCFNLVPSPIQNTAHKNETFFHEKKAGQSLEAVEIEGGRNTAQEIKEKDGEEKQNLAVKLRSWFWEVIFRKNK